jgi:Fe-S cluster assembly scaffold protein SufB
MAIPRFFTSKEAIWPSGPSADGSTRVLCGDDRLQTMTLEEAMETPEGMAALDAVAAIHDRRPAEVRAWHASVVGETTVIMIPAGQVITDVVQVLQTVSASAAHRLIFIIGEGSHVSFSIQTVLPELSPKCQTPWCVDNVDVVLGTGATLEIRRLTYGCGEQFSTNRAVVGVEAHLAWAEFQSGGGFRQVMTDVHLRGRAATARYRSGAVGSGQLHFDEACRANSTAADTVADVKSWAVINAGDKVVSGGRVTMHRSAVGAAGHQRTHGLLLARGGEFVAQPDLEAEHDTVSGGHGAALSGLDAESLFYLQSRGLDAATARRTLAAAFLGEAIDSFSGSGLELPISAIIEQSLA